jgi:hypothetical protein
VLLTARSGIKWMRSWNSKLMDVFLLIFAAVVTGERARSAAQRSAAQHSTARHSTAQHSTAQHDAAAAAPAWHLS